jgi:hypothetical protein
MDVRVRAGERVAAMLAGAARARLGAGAEQTLAEPEGQSLLPDAGWSVQQQRSGERVATDGIIQPSAQGGVTVQRKKGHA